MTCLGSPVRPGAVALTAAIACSSAPLLAQRAYAAPAGSDAAVAGDRSGAAQASDAPIAPFAVIHSIYVPSPSVVDDRPAPKTSERPRPLKSASTRAKVAATRPAERTPPTVPPADVPETDTQAASETPAAAVPPPVTIPRQAVPRAIDRPRPRTIAGQHASDR